MHRWKKAPSTQQTFSEQAGVRAVQAAGVAGGAKQPMGSISIEEVNETDLLAPNADEFATHIIQRLAPNERRLLAALQLEYETFKVVHTLLHTSIIDR